MHLSTHSVKFTNANLQKDIRQKISALPFINRRVYVSCRICSSSFSPLLKKSYYADVSKEPVASVLYSDGNLERLGVQTCSTLAAFIRIYCVSLGNGGVFIYSVI